MSKQQNKLRVELRLQAFRTELILWCCWTYLFCYISFGVFFELLFAMIRTEKVALPLVDKCNTIARMHATHQISGRFTHGIFFNFLKNDLSINFIVR